MEEKYIELNNKIEIKITLVIDNEPYELVELTDKKLLRVEGGEIIVYENEDHFYAIERDFNTTKEEKVLNM